jgi:hypothetical protein
LHAKQPARKFFYDGTSYFNAVFFTHSPLMLDMLAREKRLPEVNYAQVYRAFMFYP